MYVTYIGGWVVRNKVPQQTRLVWSGVVHLYIWLFLTNPQMHVDWFVVHYIHVYVYVVVDKDEGARAVQRSRRTHSTSSREHGEFTTHNVYVCVLYTQNISFFYWYGFDFALWSRSRHADIHICTKHSAHTQTRVRDTWRHVVNEYILFSYTTQACGIFREIICAN